MSFFFSNFAVAKVCKQKNQNTMKKRIFSLVLAVMASMGTMFLCLSYDVEGLINIGIASLIVLFTFFVSIKCAFIV